MAGLSDLLQINGVIAACEFDAEGQLVAYEAITDMPLDTAAMIAQFCATATMIFNRLATAYKRLTKMNCLPQHGWIFTGGDWTIAVGGKRGILVHTAKVDFGQLYNQLLKNRTDDLAEDLEPALVSI